jgi:hypothetical protein
MDDSAGGAKLARLIALAIADDSGTNTSARWEIAM